MATHTVTKATGEVGTAAFALTASTVDTVTFDTASNTVVIISDGAAPVWYTTTGVTPTVGGKDCYYLPATPCADTRTSLLNTPTVVKLISAGTPTLRVQAA